MPFMVVEPFRDEDVKAICRRLKDKGRMMPEGPRFMSSHIAADLSRSLLRTARAFTRRGPMRLVDAVGRLKSGRRSVRCAAAVG